MIRLSRMADYAVVVMGHIAARDGKLVSAHHLSDDTQLTLPTVSKLLKALAHAELLHATRGAHGGYSLSREADDITVADIIAAVDGPIALTDCVEDGPGECIMESCCPTRNGWQKINAAVKRALADVSLAEISGPAPFMRAQQPTQPRITNDG